MTSSLRFGFFGLAALASFACMALSRADARSPEQSPKISPVSADLAADYTLDRSFYKKSILAEGVLIASSDKVSDYTLLESAYLFGQIMKQVNPDIAQRVRDRKVLCLIIGHSELTSDLPQFKTDKTGKELDLYNWRQRGFLNMNINGHPTVVFAEEDVMEYEGGMQIESILVHEFGHVVDGAGFDKAFKDKLTACYENAKKTGLYRDGYAAQKFRRVTSETPVSLLDALVKAFPNESREFFKNCLDGGDILVNGRPADSGVKVTAKDKVLIVFGGPKNCYGLTSRAEYWAEGFQNWFDTNRTMDHDHNHIHTREQLKKYDPMLAKLCEEVLGDTAWRFVSPRERAGKDHLAGYSPAAAPTVKKLEHIDQAAQDYYDKYWKDYWNRLREKHKAR